MRRILKATAIMGSSSIVTILAGIVKNKVLAILLGPSGIGLMGLLTNLQAMAGTVAVMGFGASGVKEVAAAHSRKDLEQVALVRQALLGGAVFFGSIVAAGLYMLRVQVAIFVLDDPSAGQTVAWIAIGVVALALAGVQVAFLNGLHRIGDLAKINITRAVLGLVVAVIAIWLLRENGIIIAVVSIPFINLAASYRYVKKIDLPQAYFSFKAIIAPFYKLLGMGAALMITALMATGTQMLVKVIITRNLGIEATGYFQASWSISMMYLGFVLSAMGTDYFPRLSGSIHDQEMANNMVNKQVEVALLLCSPVISAMIFFSPLVIKLLYSAEFVATVPVLQWQLVGDFFKIASWPLGFILLARGASRAFFCTELVWNMTYITGVIFGLNFFGLKAVGIAFLVAYVFFFFVLGVVTYRLNKFVWSKKNKQLLLGMGGAICGVMVLSNFSGVLHVALAITIIGAMAIFSIVKINTSVGIFSSQRK